MVPTAVSALYRLPLVEPEEVTYYLHTPLHLHLIFISPSSSPSGAPILLMAKKDDTSCMCINYRAWHAVVLKDRYPFAQDS